MGLLILVLIICIVITAIYFISYLYDKLTKNKNTKKGILISAILLVLFTVFLCVSIEYSNSSFNGNEIARYKEDEYDLNQIYIEYSKRYYLNLDSYTYDIKIVKEDIENYNYIVVYRGYGEYENRFIVIYHIVDNDNHYIDDMNEYKRR